MTFSSTRVLPTTSIIKPTDNVAMTSFIDAMASAFDNTAMTRSFSAEIDGRPSPSPSAKINHACVLRYIDASIRGAVRDGATLIEAGGMSAVAVWLAQEPESQAVGDSMAYVGPLRRSYLDQVTSAKRKYIGTIPQAADTATCTEPQLRPHLHLEFLGRNPHRPRVTGAISAVMLPFLEQARQDNALVWLEATSPNAVRIYEHYGFRVVEKIVVQTGEKNTDGLLEEADSDSDSGIPAWGMIWRSSSSL